MFNDYANHVPWSAYLEAFSEIKLPVVLPKAAFNLEAPRRHLADRRRANRPPCRGKGRIAQMRWGFPPARPKAPPVINFRSEGRRFERGRCLVPASWFMNSAATRCRRRSGSSPSAARIGSVSPDCGGRQTTMARRHSRSHDSAGSRHRARPQWADGVLERGNCVKWLDATAPFAELLRALPEGSLGRERVR